VLTRRRHAKGGDPVRRITIVRLLALVGGVLMAIFQGDFIWP